jgi:RNA polymerase sigma-B factor
VPHQQISEPRESMIVQHLPLADSLARRYSYTSEPLDDLTQVARLGLLKAVERWDPDRGTAFSTFALPTIKGELQRHFRDRTWTIRPPRDLQELYVRVQRTRSRLATELGREPTARDVAEVIGCAVEAVVEALQAGDAYAPQSLDAPLQADQDAGATELDRVPEGRAELARTENATALRQLGQVLDERSWEVVRLRFEEDLLQREIAERVGCSQMHVSRILRDAIARLQQAADEAGVSFD